MFGNQNILDYRIVFLILKILLWRRCNLIATLNDENCCTIAVDFYLKFILLFRHVSNEKKRWCTNHYLSLNVLLCLVEL